MSETQLATNGFGSMFSWQEMKGKKSNALHFSMASCSDNTQKTKVAKTGFKVDNQKYSACKFHILLNAHSHLSTYDFS